MRPRTARIFATALVCLAMAANAAAATFDDAALGKLGSVRAGASLVIDGFPGGPTRRDSLKFQRVQIYSVDAHIYATVGKQQKELPRSDLVFLRGYSSDGATRVALTLNADGSFAHGAGVGPEGTFVLQADAAARGGVAAESMDLPPGVTYDFRCGNEHRQMSTKALGQIAAQVAQAPDVAAVTATAHGLRYATVAVDTDSLYMSKLFSNNTTQATNWIATLFNDMNVMYERDLLVELFQGTTFLCGVGCVDPYTALSVIPADDTDLSAFGAYWKANHAAVTRTFALLLSGQEPSTSNSCSASGIAWIDQYCQKGFVQLDGKTVGGYSVDQVCTSTNAFFGPAFSALLVGHELGHNFGASHTHCTDKTTGTSDVAANTIDVCYNGEGATHVTGGTCYDGVESCPAVGDGPGAPAGTIMSYCNVDLGCGGATTNHQNVLQFHPTHINKVLLPAITAAPAGCLNTLDGLFFNDFEQIF